MTLTIVNKPAANATTLRKLYPAMEISPALPNEIASVNKHLIIGLE